MAESRPLRSSRDAVALRAIVGATIGDCSFLTLKLIMGLAVYLNPNSSSGSWRWGYQVTKDGLPTLFGWLFELLNLLYFTLAGLAGGLAARWAALPKSERVRGKEHGTSGSASRLVKLTNDYIVWSVINSLLLGFHSALVFCGTLVSVTQPVWCGRRCHSEHSIRQ